jgi:lipoprotein-anchoring transpeptidase ErfK/SrfK
MARLDAAEGHDRPREKEGHHPAGTHAEGGPTTRSARARFTFRASLYRMHGTNNPSSIGGAVSSGCIRLTNTDIIDLYKRAKVGAKVIVRR